MNIRKRIRIVAAVMLALLAVCLLPTTAQAKTGWVKSSKGWSYYITDSNYAKDGLYKIDGAWYGFDNKGYMLTGWYKDTYEWEGETYTTWYYLKSDGSAAKGWQWIGNAWYYFDAYDNGVPPQMISEGSYMVGKLNYVFSSSGALVTGGWYNHRWSYDGNTFSTWYYTDSNGVAATGWKNIGGTWYFFWDWGGMASNQVFFDGSNYYGLLPSGAMATGWYQCPEDGSDLTGEWLYCGSNGAARRGWQQVGGTWYYFEPNKDAAPIMYAGDSDGKLFNIGGTTYCLKSSGAMVANGWGKEDGNWYYFNGSGAMVKSQWVGNYYVGSDGVMATDTWIGKYHVDANGLWDKTK